MKVIAVDDLPGDPLAAAAVFHQHWLPFAEEVLASGQDLLIAFAPADHTHNAWRRAAVASLARKHAPRRANAVTTGQREAMQGAQDYLTGAPGVTGQYLPLCGGDTGKAGHTPPNAAG
ncbi:Rossmann fold domain-containing protein [Pelagerythrobacter marensis]|uniref:Short chain dehydrogenase-like proteobacteria domain-containing protein n=1 Tax=Pelagerythrobacter marensis TaxID=543877 RepID=A0A0G3X8B5_9SPHN|nr:hypothetical protein [Pelagerythrobacter marensis]AKM07442.1 hypothetical protein AM2010_1370 [Pelagerythrobacter marensis]